MLDLAINSLEPAKLIPAIKTTKPKTSERMLTNKVLSGFGFFLFKIKIMEYINVTLANHEIALGKSLAPTIQPPATASQPMAPTPLYTGKKSENKYKPIAPNKGIRKFILSIRNDLV